MEKENLKINNSEELYKKILPALYSKVCELKRKNINYIDEADIWSYLCKEYWQNTTSLTLGEMVGDILSTPNEKLEKYLLNIKKQTKNEEKDDALL